MSFILEYLAVKSCDIAINRAIQPDLSIREISESDWHSVLPGELHN
jgi:hypothetical protein